MKLKIPDGFTDPTVTNLGAIYPVDKGHVDIPEADVHDGLFAQGFTVAVAAEPSHETKAVKVTALETKG